MMRQANHQMRALNHDMSRTNQEMMQANHEIRQVISSSGAGPPYDEVGVLCGEVVCLVVGVKCLQMVCGGILGFSRICNGMVTYCAKGASWTTLFLTKENRVYQESPVPNDQFFGVVGEYK